MERRVVITSWSAITSLGSSAEEIVGNLQNKNISFERPDFDPEVVVCPVQDFDLRSYTGRFKNRRYLNRGAAFSVASAMQTIRCSGLESVQLENTGLYVGTGPNLDITEAFSRTDEGEADFSANPALWMLEFLANTAGSIISQLGGIHGESLSIQTACAAGLQSIGEAYRKVKQGIVDTALAGAGDSRLNKGGIAAYKKAQAIHVGEGEPGRVCRPFAQERNGFVTGEGGAFFLLESLEQARERGANIVAEVCGFGASMDGQGMTAPAEDGKYAQKAVENALQDAGMQPSNIDLVSAHGTGTLLNDKVEADILQRVFASSKPRVTAIKSWIGHLSAACGAAELGVILSCMQQGYIPQIRNLENPCSEDVFFLTDASKHRPDRILLQNFGFGGQNSALVIERWEQ
ncbi:MAG: beta-ketoacyl-[acyl-carrier-protein] synthase family protein [Thermodesulfobacteriota bacterium]